MTGPWEHTTEWRDRFEKLQEPTIDPAGDPLAAFLAARIIELDTMPRFDLTDELHDTPGGAIAQRYAEHLRKDCVVYRKIAAAYCWAKGPFHDDEDADNLSGLRLAVLAVANRWTEHPDFQDEWRLT